MRGLSFGFAALDGDARAAVYFYPSRFKQASAVKKITSRRARAESARNKVTNTELPER